MFRGECSLPVIVEFAVHVFCDDDTNGVSEQMFNGDKRGVIFYKVRFCGGSVYCIPMGTELNLHKLRIGKQIHINIFHGFTSKFIIIIKAIILIDLFYMAGIKMVKHYDAGETQYAGYLIFLTLII